MGFELLIEDLIKSSNQKSIGTDKGLAKIGDAVVNLIYSLAKSIYLTNHSKSRSTIRTGDKVSKTILSAALKNADLKSFAKNRADAHAMADTVEAIIGYVWLKNCLSLQQMTELLVKQLKGDLYDRREEIQQATLAFTELLNHVKQYLPKK